MMPAGTPPIAPGDLIPRVELAVVPDGTPHGLRTESRDARVLLVLPSDHGPWHDYLRELSAAAPDIHYWYASTLVVVATGPADAARLRAGAAAALEVAADPGADVAGRIGLPVDSAMLVIADRYGQVYGAWTGEDGKGLPPAAEVEEWTRFLATQCPECGVIDQPTP
jgi:hypothetical protein